MYLIDLKSKISSLQKLWDFFWNSQILEYYKKLNRKKANCKKKYREKAKYFQINSKKRRKKRDTTHNQLIQTHISQKEITQDNMNSQYPQPYLPNNANQQRSNRHLNYPPQQPQQPTYQFQQYNWKIALQKDIFSTPQQPEQQNQQFSNVQQLIKNRPQPQQSQQQQSIYSYQQSSGQNDFKFSQIGNNVVEGPPKQSNQAPNTVQWARNAGSVTRPFSTNNYPQQNPHFQKAQQQSNNLNLPSIRQNCQQTQQQQQQQSKLPINPYLTFPNDEIKQLIPAQQRQRAQEALPVNPQNSVIKPEEELFKCQANNCTNSFIKKKSDTMTTMCSDCKNEKRKRFDSPQIMKCSSCSKPITNTFLTGKLCYECSRKKNEALGKEEQQQTKDLSYSASQPSNQLGSNNTVVSPRSNWKDAQNSLALEKQTKEQEKEQSAMQLKQQKQPSEQAKALDLQNLKEQDHSKQANNNPQQQQWEKQIKQVNEGFQQRDQQKLQEGKAQNQNLDLLYYQAQRLIQSFQQQLQQIQKQNQSLDSFQKAKIIIQNFQQKLQQLLEQVNRQILDQQQEQNQQNVKKSGCDKQLFSQPGDLAQQREQETSQQMNNPQGTNCLNQIISSNQLDNQSQLSQNKPTFQQNLQPNKLQSAQQTNDNRQYQSLPISSANALYHPLQNQTKDQLQQPSVSSVENGFNNNTNIMNREFQSIANAQSNQNQSSNKDMFACKTPQQAGGTNNVNLKPNFEYKDKQQLAFSQVNNQFQPSQLNNQASNIDNFQTSKNYFAQNKAPVTQNPQKNPPLYTQNSSNIKEQPSTNMYISPFATINLQQKREDQNPFTPLKARQKINFQPDNLNSSSSKITAPSGATIRSGSIKNPTCAICQSSMPSYYKEQFWYCQCYKNPKKLENPLYVQKS